MSDFKPRAYAERADVLLRDRSASGGDEVIARAMGPVVASTRKRSGIGFELPHQTRQAEVLPTERQLRSMASANPRGLVALVRGGTLPPGLLSRAAEAMGLIEDHALAVPTLLELLESTDLVVQEASIYGLAMHPTPEVRTALHRVADCTSRHTEIRAIANEALEDLSEEA